MTELEHRLAAGREEIARHVASFKATQQKFAREREAYYVATLENARLASDHLPATVREVQQLVAEVRRLRRDLRDLVAGMAGARERAIAALSGRPIDPGVARAMAGGDRDYSGDPPTGK